MEARDVDRRLSNVDWDFAQAKTSGGTHWFHPYPAKFIPQIPARLVAGLSSPGEVVLDPFCGSGTTLVEAIAAGRSALGADVNPVAVLVARAKTLRLDDGDVEAVGDLLRTIEAWRDTAAGRLRLMPLSDPQILIPADEAIDFWFEPAITAELGLIAGAVSQCQSAKARLLAKVALSAIIVGVSKQDSDTRYVRREKKLKPSVAIHRFKARAQKMVAALPRLAGGEGVSAEAWIGDARRLPLASGCADLAVTSPPYPNAYSYYLYHRTRLLWLGFDPAALKQIEIGNHRHYSARNGASRATFRADMTACFRELRRVLRPRRYACFVIGDSMIRGEVVHNDLVLNEAAADAGFTLAESYGRSIDLGRKSFNPAIGKIKREHILVFRAP